MMNQSPQSLLVKGKNAFLSLSHANLREKLLFILLLLFLPTQLGKHFWPDYSLLSGFRVDYLSPTLYLTDLIVLNLFIHWCERIIKRPLRYIFPLMLPYLLVALYLLLTLVNAQAPLAGLVMLLRVMEMLFVAGYTAHYLTPLLREQYLPLLFTLTMIGESLLALAQTANKGSLGGIFYYGGERAMSSLTPGAATAVLNGEVFLRAYGTFSHPNVLAGYLLISLVFIYRNKQAFSFRFGTPLFLGALILGSAGLLVTLSRIPLLLWLGFLLVSWLVTAFQRLKEHSLLPHRLTMVRGVVGVMSMFIIVIILFPFFNPVLTRFTQSRFAEEAFVVRTDLNNTALSLLAKHPLLGVGLGNFLFSSIHYKQADTPLFLAVQPVHNIALLVLVETGILGGFLFLWLLYLTWKVTSRTGKILLTLILLTGMFDHYWLTLQQGQLLFAVVIGYCWSVRYNPKPGKQALTS